MDEGINIRPVGLSYAGEGISAETVNQHQLRISQAATLKDLSSEYAWFSLALMYTHIPLMGRDPWADYILETGHADTFQMTIKFDRPIFRGLQVGANQEYNHVLWAMERDRWDEYCQWMGRVSFIDRDQDTAVKLRTQTIQIADPLYFDKVVIMPATCPVVDITVFVIDANYGCVYMKCGDGNPLLDLPRACRGLAYEDTKIWSAAALNNHPDPFGLIEADPLNEITERVRKAREQNEN